MDLAPTFCQLAGADVPDWMEGRPLPTSQQEAEKQGRESVITQYESHTPEVSIIMNGVYANGMYCVAYEHTVTYDGTEGELYDLEEDPRQRVNLWDDPARLAVREEMRSIIYDTLFTRPQFHPMPEPGALI
jgi:arylsulfatase A-like enzyme